MKKVVIQLNIHSDKEKKKALKAVSSVHGVDSVTMDMSTKKLTIIGDVDPVCLMCKLSCSWCPEIISVGPKEEPKKEEKKPDKKEEPKCVCGGHGHESFACTTVCYRPQTPCYPPMVVQCVEDYPSSCVIC